MQQEFAMIPPPASAAWFFAVIALILVPILLLLAYCAFSMYSVKFFVTDDGLRLKGDLYGRTIPWSEIQMEDVRAIDLANVPELQSKWKTLGTALPGYKSGWFKLRNGEKGLLYVTNQAKVVDIPTSKGYRVMLSVDQPTEFLAAVRAQTGH